MADNCAQRSRAAHEAEVNTLLYQAIEAAAHAGMTDEELATRLKKLQRERQE